MILSGPRRSALIAVTALALGAVAEPADADTLTGARFMETHVGKCISYKGESVGIQCFHADGTMEYDDESYGKDTGTWSVKDDMICQEWSSDPGVACVPFTDEGGGVYSDGSYTWTIN